MFKLNTKCDADSLLYSLNHFQCNDHTQLTCSLNGIYHPHWLVLWSHHCSHMHIPVYSPWLQDYIDVTHTIVIILTVAALFPDRPHIYILYIGINISVCNYLYTKLSKSSYWCLLSLLMLINFHRDPCSCLPLLISPTPSNSEKLGSHHLPPIYLLNSTTYIYRPVAELLIHAP